MLSAQRRTLYVATIALVAFASSVDAMPKGKGSSLKSKTSSTSSGGGGGSSCYDSQGNLIVCPMSKTQWIIIGAIGGLVVLVAIILSLYCTVRKRIEGRAFKMKDTKGAHQKIPDEEATLNEPSADEPDQKQAGGVEKSEKSEESEESEEESEESEKLDQSTLYDPVSPVSPVSPSRHYDHQYSDSASIASSVYYAPPLRYAQLQDYSYQHHYHTNVTAAQSETHDTPPSPSLNLDR